jgi:hypothetical protein
MSLNNIAQRHGRQLVEDFLCNSTNGTNYPGMLAELYNNSGVLTAKNHALAGGSAMPMFFLEDSLQGVEPDTAYTSGRSARVGTFQSGDLVAAMVASGETISKASKLESAGNGKLRVMTSAGSSYLSEDSWIASVETCSASPVTLGADTLVLVRIR